MAAVVDWASARGMNWPSTAPSPMQIIIPNATSSFEWVFMAIPPCDLSALSVSYGCAAFRANLDGGRNDDNAQRDFSCGELGR